MGRICYMLLWICLQVILLSSCSPQVDTTSYAAQIDDHRKERHEYMATSESSPFKDLEFRGLNYFEPDITYKVMASVEKTEKLEYLQIPTSTGKVNRYLKYGTAHFELGGAGHSLLLMKLVGLTGSGDMVFVAFSDLTNGEETYGGGRYLDLNYKGIGKMEIDFNKAYNPYCEYNDSFSCPLPPKQNQLNIRITAGEKRYDGPEEQKK